MGVSWKNKCRRKLICIENSKKHAALVTHVKKCKKANCIPCFAFDILGSAKLPPWARRCPDDESSASWIEYRWPDPSSTSSFQLRCSLCESGGWSMFSTYRRCSIYHLKRHASSFHHMMILTKSLGHAKVLAVDCTALFRSSSFCPPSPSFILLIKLFGIFFGPLED